MHKRSRASTSIFGLTSLIAIAACGGTSETAGAPAPGKVMGTGYIANARVCIDRNSNYACDADEPWTTTNPDGIYDINALRGNPGEINKGILIARYTTANAKNPTNGTSPNERVLSALPGNPELISPLTHFGRQLAPMAKTTDRGALAAQIAERYGLAVGTDVFGDYVANNDQPLTNLARYLENYQAIAVETEGTESTAEGFAPLIDRVAADAFEVSDATKAFLNMPPRPQRVMEYAEPAEAIAAPPADNFANVPFSQGMKFGAGWDDIRSRLVGNADCLEGFEIESNKNYKENFNLKLIRNKEEAAKELDVSGKIVLDTKAFDMTIQGRFYNAMQMDQNAVYMLAKYDITLRDFRIKAAKMELDGYGDCEPYKVNCSDEPDSQLLNNRTGNQPNTIRSYFRDQYDKFRLKCGDRYIHTITTGGSYYGLLKVSAGSQQEKLKIEASLSAKLSKFSIEGKLALLHEELRSQENTEIMIMKTGTGASQLVVATAEQFDQDLEAFKAGICGVHPDACSQVEDASDAATTDPSQYDWTRAPYRAKFETYEPTVHEILQGGNVRAQRVAMDRFVFWKNRFTDVYNDITNMIQYPMYYQGAKARLSELQKRRAHVLHQMDVIQDLYFRCDAPVGYECIDLPNAEALALQGLRSVDELRDGGFTLGTLGTLEPLPAPAVRFAKNCKEYKEIYPFTSKEDAEYVLYMGGRPTQPYFMYCKDMKETNPKDYLLLPNNDPLSDNPVHNFAQYVDLIDPNAELAAVVAATARRTVTSVYRGLRVTVNNDALKWNPANLDTDAMVQTSGAGAVDPETLGAPKSVALFGTTMSCSPTERVGANINLQGTPFVLAPGTSFVVPDKQYEFVASAKNWAGASADASTRGGRLLLIVDDKDNQKFATALYNSGNRTSWLGLKFDRLSQGYFSWSPAPGCSEDVSCFYRNWAPGSDPSGLPITGELDLCASMRNTDSKWEYSSCVSQTNVRPYFIEYEKIIAHSEPELVSPDLQSVDLYISSKIQPNDKRLACGTYRPSHVLVFKYSDEIARDVPGLSDLSE